MKAKKLDWKAIKQRESYFLRHGHFPPKDWKPERKKPALMFGHNTVR